MKCKDCGTFIDLTKVHQDDHQYLIKDGLCWLCRAKGIKHEQNER